MSAPIRAQELVALPIWDGHIVVSRTLQTISWKNTTIVRDLENIRRLKEAPGGDMHVVGGASLVIKSDERGTGG